MVRFKKLNFANESACSSNFDVKMHGDPYANFGFKWSKIFTARRC